MPTSSSSELELPDLPETPDTSGVYPRLTAEQIMLLSRYGERKQLTKASKLFCEGDRDCGVFVVLDGRAAVVQESSPVGEPRVIAVHGPGRFVGDLSMLTGQAVYVTAVAVTDVEVLEVPFERLKEAVTQDQVLGDLILRAFIVRRSIHANVGAGLRIIGSRYSGDTRRLRDFVSRNRIPYRWEDLEEDPEAEVALRAFAVPPDQIPVVIWKGQTVLRNPSNTELAELLGLREDAPRRDAYDVLVVGAGPAGLAAAVAAASEGLSTVVLDSIATGGQAATSSQIENYLGFPAGISGAELADRAVVQARKFGAAFVVPGEARSLDTIEDHIVVRLGDGAQVEAHTVVLATGVRYRRLDVPGMDRLEGPSVYYAATEFEARLCRGDPVTVVGGGNSAGQAALFLARNTTEVNLVIRHDDLNRDMSRYLAERVVSAPRVHVWRNSEVCELEGDLSLEKVVVHDLRTDERRTLSATALFVLIGAEPHTRWLDGAIPLDDRGFVLTGADVGGADMFATARAGVFAVGDVRSGSVKRVASAVGEGAVAVRLVYEHLVRAGRR
ncbi:FAD-dependent oxidoreductase [Phycicoccus sp. Root101]|uniref:FAD-dependent oxidoreductase n=1 Tax=Phycicoccus sp. Root101 TaxID=1736421 RepID=UPI000702E5A1|nr:FAD-dependent oxidoreductase [Phycicoccus sp. Root101]KQU66534.1 cyclic nucleotide-binding protein [Phycicoccus sp. Root101]